MIEKCECGNKLELVGAWDDPYPENSIPYAFNLYMCYHCGNITKENVWNDKHVLTLRTDGTIVKEK